MRNSENCKYSALIEKSVAEMEFADEFKIFVSEVLKRRAIQFDFTKEQVELDLRRLSVSLKSITVEFEKIYFAGSYCISNKSLNMNSFCNYICTNESLYATFTHELYHALAVEDGKDTMADFNMYSGEENGSLLEVIVEKASYQNVFPVKTKNPYYNLNSDGYISMAFATEMLSATFGISEFEFIKNGIQGKERLIKYLANKAHCEEITIMKFLDSFEMNLAIIHGIAYDYDKKINPFIKGKNIAEALGRMKKICAHMMMVNLDNLPENEITDEKIEDLKYNFNKLNEAVKQGSKYIRINPLNLGFSFKRVNEISNSSMEQYANGIAQTECINNYKKTKKIPEVLKPYIKWACYGNLGNYEFDNDTGKKLKDYEIDLPERLTAKTKFSISKEVIKRNNAPQEKIEKWDNSIIKQNYFRALLIKISLKNRMSSILNFIMGEKKKSLPPLENPENDDEKINVGKESSIRFSWDVPKKIKEEANRVSTNSKQNEKDTSDVNDIER